MSIQVDLTGRRAIVTGGGRGIGRGIALGLARCGADVAIVYRQGAEEAEATAAEVTALGRRALAVQADTSDGASVRRWSSASWPSLAASRSSSTTPAC